jgi:hypothetical protein
MSLEDFNRGWNEGHLAKLPQNLSESMGRQAYLDAVTRGTGSSETPSTWLPATSEAPRWMTHHAFKRGLAFYLGSKVLNTALFLITGGKWSGWVEIATIILAFMHLAGIGLMICGVLNFLTRKRRRKA